MKSSHGCWTCRLRRKKCDEKKPICGACSLLHIQCHSSARQEKPEWMDGSVKQAAMSAHIKQEIKVAKTHRRPRQSQSPSYNNQSRGLMVFGSSDSFTRSILSDISTSNLTESMFIDPAATLPSPVPTISSLPFGVDNQNKLSHKNHHDNNGYQMLEESDIVLIPFYLEKVLPFLYPSYRPTLLQGGKGWILELFLKRWPFRQAILCQSLHFSSLWETGNASSAAYFDEVLAQTKSSVLQILGAGLQHANKQDISRTAVPTIRIMTCILLLHRLEITVLSFKHWQTHLEAVVSLFNQLFNDHLTFHAVVEELGSQVSLPTLPTMQIPNAVQAALTFSSSLIVFDDIIASTTLQQQPKLYNHHSHLLSSGPDGHAGGTPIINMELVFGIQNWVVQQIGEIAVLDAWKLEHRRAGDLDVFELASRASVIRDALSTNLKDLEDQPSQSKVDQTQDNMLNSQKRRSSGRTVLNTRIWAHTALLYLFVVTSGWQPANENVRYHVTQTLEMLSLEAFPPELLHSTVWPFCVAGCLAAPFQAPRFRQLVQRLDPKLFGKLLKALEVLEEAWKDERTSDRDFGTCFRALEDPVLLV